MKKSFVAVLVILALVVIVSPGILGGLAEKSVDENINWAAAEQGDVVVTSDSFDRGWFSSEGQHRIEVRGGNLAAMLTELTGPGEALPVLVISTHLDHGLIPLSSLARENGSLAPGLGSAVSTLSVELGSGETIEIPGKIYSKAGLGGEVESSYQVAAGSRSDGHSKAAWGTSRIDVTTNPARGKVSFAGDIKGIEFSDRKDSIGIGGITFSGDQLLTKYGFSVGGITMQLNDMSVGSNGSQVAGIKAMNVDGQTTLDGDRVGGRTTFNIQTGALPQFGEVTLDADLSLADADAEALGRLSRTLNALGPNPDPMQTFPSVEGDLKRLLARGLEMRFDRLDVALPMGTVAMTMDLKVAEEDLDTFEWTSLLLGTEGNARLSIPDALVDMALAGNPQAGAMLGMGLLVKNGDVYELDARLEKGLLTINGAPIPIPMGAF